MHFHGGSLGVGASGKVLFGEGASFLLPRAGAQGDLGCPRQREALVPLGLGEDWGFVPWKIVPEANSLPQLQVNCELREGNKICACPRRH